MQRIVALVLFFACSLGAVAQSAGEYFSLGVNAYSKGDYDSAKEFFAKSLEKAQTPQGNYNLANACLKLGQNGLAKAYYMRALYEMPRFREAQSNLNSLDKKMGFDEFSFSKYDEFLNELSYNEWVAAAAISLWGAIFLLVVLPLMRKSAAWQIFLGIILFLLFFVSACGAFYWREYLNCVVAVGGEPVLTLSPANESPVVATLKEGQLAQIESQNNGFVLIETNGGKKGWARLDGKAFKKVAP